MNKNFFRASAEDFKKIPGSPVAYWVGASILSMFSQTRVSDFSDTRVGLITGDNEHYVRSWYEISCLKFSRPEEIAIAGENKKWVAFAKGGPFRKWYGNILDVVNWESDGNELLTTMHTSGKRTLAHNFNLDKKFIDGVTWTKISSGSFSARYYPSGCLFNDASANAFCKAACQTLNLLGLLASKLPSLCLGAINPTLNFLPGDVAVLPCKSELMTDKTIGRRVRRLVEVTRTDWDAYETSWDFKSNPLVAETRNASGASEKSEFQIEALYKALRERWAWDCEEIRRLETENNRIFIEAYGLQDELTPEVPWHEITLTCNPFYRYGVKSGQCLVDSDQHDTSHSPLASNHSLPLVTDLEERLKADTVKELISYAVGCMMGRYSLEKPGLILADQGAQISDQWIVVSGQLVLRGKVAECVRKELQRIDCLAEGDGSCGRSVSTGETAPDGGTVCIVGSASSGGGFNSVECRRGAGTEYDAGLHELSDNGTSVVLRDGNTIVDLCSAEVLDAIASGSGAELVRRGWKDAERIDWKTIHSSLTTSHFSPDKDGIIPILDNDWFADDIVTRFREFIKVAFGEVHFFENMAWIEGALGKDIRSYFTKDFYKDHLQRYQNRPIYWLFQSPKGAFRALVYMHRYKPDMVGGVLGYLRSLQTKVENQLGVAMQIASDESKSSTERVRANKEVVKYSKMQKELDEYEKNVLYPLSTERIEIDLDDGVKANYRKFGTALRKVAALERKGE